MFIWYKTEYPLRSTLSRSLKFVIPSFLREQFIQINRMEAVQISFITELAQEEVRTPFKTLTVTEGYLGNLKKKLQLTS